MSKDFVQKLLKQKKIKGHVEPRKHGGSIKSELDMYKTQLAQMVEKYPDAALSEYINPKHLKNLFTSCCYCAS